MDDKLVKDLLAELIENIGEAMGHVCGAIARTHQDPAYLAAFDAENALRQQARQ